MIKIHGSLYSPFHVEAITVEKTAIVDGHQKYQVVIHYASGNRYQIQNGLNSGDAIKLRDQIEEAMREATTPPFLEPSEPGDLIEMPDEGKVKP